MPPHVCACGVDHTTCEGRAICCQMEHRKEQAADVSVCIAADCVGLSNTVEDCARRKCPFADERREGST